MASSLYYENRVDVIFCDIVLPDGNGLDFISEIRKKDSISTVVMYSAHSAEVYLLKAANSGVDGYILKPGSREEIKEAIVKAIKQRGRIELEVKLTKDTLYYPLKKQVFRNNTKIDIGHKEHQLLELLVDNSNKVVTKSMIVETIWPLESVTESALKNLLSRLRAKIDGIPIRSIRGEGWMLELEGRETLSS